MRPNFDIGFHRDLGIARAGVMTLNHLGLLMGATYFWTKYVSIPLATEAWVSVEEIWFAREMGFGSMEIEGDSLVVIMKLRSPLLDHSDISSYVLEAQQLAKTFTTCRYQHIHREGNSVAHLMAQEGFLLLNCLLVVGGWP
ncbi:hypothetical protein Gotri_027824 [Gossypium trilobum]|uniref:RNase H type-1 domain-containing protein n=1 Tax=Gossypium trilobum TaxID=34281 RepID=A0A7J9FNY0_9ROSI|nr:hypothetical protein [Gossypium trilobum]